MITDQTTSDRPFKETDKNQIKSHSDFVADGYWYIRIGEKSITLNGQTVGLWTFERRHKTLGGLLSEELHGHFGTASACSFRTQIYWLTS